MASFSIDTHCGNLGVEVPSNIEADPVEDRILELFNEMRAPVLRHLLWMNLRPDQAEDVLQETFLRLYQHLLRDEFSRRNLRGWIWRVAHNLGVNLRLTVNRNESGAELALGLDEFGTLSVEHGADLFLGFNSGADGRLRMLRGCAL